MPQKIKLAVEDTIVDKIPPNSPLWRIASTGFRNVEFTVQELADHINQGHPLCAQHQGRRTQANFLCSDIVAVDIDDGMRLEEALVHPYVQQHAAILYTTPSHTDENHRFRIIFALPRTITDVAEMRAAYTGLIYKFGGDESCKDACRLFFGSKGSDPIILGNVMTSDALDELLLLGQETRASDSRGSQRSSNKKSQTTTRRSNVLLKKDQEVELTNGRAFRLSAINTGQSIYCPVHVDNNPSAFIVENRHGVKGVHCRACAATFWPPSAFPKRKKIDFYAAESIAKEMEYEEDPERYCEDEQVRPGLIAHAQTERSFFTFSRRYLSLLHDAKFEGLTFIRSPKGTGKTEDLKEVVAWCKQNGLSVLLVGHRQTLLSGMAQRLGMTCYYYMTANGQRNNQPEDYYAVCLDSIGKLLKTDKHRYDVVLIDEAEQVFSHLTGGTMKGKRRDCMMKLFHYMKVARSVIVSDADLGMITVTALGEIIKPAKPYRFFLNSHKESHCPFSMYDSDKHLVEEMVQTIKAGGRHYIATNSKNKAEMLEKLIHKACGTERKVLLVTSTTTKEVKVVQLLENIATEILNYDVVIASPTMGTGIDITFPNNSQLIDTVFGFFEACINTHFDIDQQLARVRQPKEIKVWVSPQHFSFETDPSVIRYEILDNGLLNDALLGIRDDGTPELDETYLSIYIQVTSISRASKNNLRQNLEDLRKRNGWNVVQVAADTDAMKTGRVRLDEAKAIAEAQRIDNLCSAEKIDFEQYQELKDKSRTGVPLDDALLKSMRRHEIEAFYREDISPDLVMLDDHGAYRGKIRLMHIYLLSAPTLKEQALKERDAEKLAPDRDNALVKKAVLHELLESAGIANAFGDINTDLQLTKSGLMDFAKACQRRARKIQELFDIHVRKDVEKKPMQQLSIVLDLIGLTTTPAERKKVAGEIIYLYRVDEASLKLAKEIVERRVTPAKETPHLIFLTDAARAKKRAEEKEIEDRKKKQVLG